MSNVTKTPKVSIGLGTQAGYGTGLLLFVSAVVAYFNGDHSNANVAVVLSGVLVAVTTAGRMLQAVIAQKQAKQPVVFSGSSGAGVTGAEYSAHWGDAAADVAKQRQAKMTPVDTSSASDTPESVAAEEAELPSDDEETQNTPIPGSAQVPVAPAGEPPTDLPLPPPLEPGDTTTT